MYSSTKNSKKTYSFKETIYGGIPTEGGLFVPTSIPTLEKTYFENIAEKSIYDIALTISELFIDTSIVPRGTLETIVRKTFQYPIPLIKVHNDLSILELFHGPTRSFKDFGSIFLAELFGYIQKNINSKLTILTASTGDTGAAVASAFRGIPNIEVFILYPHQSPDLLNKQHVINFNDNINGLEIKGNFTDCQKLVNQCFRDTDFKQHVHLTSANSVNFFRLIPQIIFCFIAYKQYIKNHNNQSLNLIIPSGNLGNLTAAVYAKKMGLPIDKIIAATNANDVFPNYIESSIWEPTHLKHTLSRSMDVNIPSNIERVFYLYKSSWHRIKSEISSHAIDDNTTLKIISNYLKKYDIALDPHTAVGIGNYLLESMVHSDQHFILYSSAHPNKYKALINSLDSQVMIPHHPSNHESNGTHPIQTTTLNNNLQQLQKEILKKLNISN